MELLSTEKSVGHDHEIEETELVRIYNCGTNTQYLHHYLQCFSDHFCGIKSQLSGKCLSICCKFSSCRSAGWAVLQFSCNGSHLCNNRE